jgi:hypothetical protein
LGERAKNASSFPVLEKQTAIKKTPIFSKTGPEAT